MASSSRFPSSPDKFSEDDDFVLVPPRKKRGSKGKTKGGGKLFREAVNSVKPVSRGTSVSGKDGNHSANLSTVHVKKKC